MDIDPKMMELARRVKDEPILKVYGPKGDKTTMLKVDNDCLSEEGRGLLGLSLESVESTKSEDPESQELGPLDFYNPSEEWLLKLAQETGYSSEDISHILSYVGSFLEICEKVAQWVTNSMVKLSKTLAEFIQNINWVELPALCDKDLMEKATLLVDRGVISKRVVHLARYGKGLTWEKNVNRVYRVYEKYTSKNPLT